MTYNQTPNWLGLAHETVGLTEHLAAEPLVLSDEYAVTAVNMKNQERTHRDFSVLRTLAINSLPARVLRLA